MQGGKEAERRAVKQEEQKGLDDSGSPQAAQMPCMGNQELHAQDSALEEGLRLRVHDLSRVPKEEPEVREVRHTQAL